MCRIEAPDPTSPAVVGARMRGQEQRLIGTQAPVLGLKTARHVRSACIPLLPCHCARNVDKALQRCPRVDGKSVDQRAKAIERDEMRQPFGPDARIDAGDVATEAVTDDGNAGIAEQCVDQDIEIRHEFMQPVALREPLAEAVPPPVWRNDAPIVAQLVDDELKRDRTVARPVQEQDRRRVIGSPAPDVAAQAASSKDRVME